MRDYNKNVPRHLISMGRKIYAKMGPLQDAYTGI